MKTAQQILAQIYVSFLKLKKNNYLSIWSKWCNSGHHHSYFHTKKYYKHLSMKILSFNRWSSLNCKSLAEKIETNVLTICALKIRFFILANFLFRFVSFLCVCVSLADLLFYLHDIFPDSMHDKKYEWKGFRYVLSNFSNVF